MKTLLCIPTLNAGRTAHDLLRVLKQQTLQPGEILVIDSSSDDGSCNIFRNAGVRVHNIPRSAFNHGGTRQLAIEFDANADIVAFITQDSLFASNDAFENLLNCFSDEKVAAAYGRQLPAHDATLISRHARLFNYPCESSLRSIEDAPRIGIKTAFFSNSFAGYRRSALMSVGGFPKNTIFGEDTFAAAKLLVDNWKIAYCAEALVYHSHNYSFGEEFHRCFDIGVFHSREPWFLSTLGRAEGEGRKFVMSEIRFLLNGNPLLIPSALLRTVLKFTGYKLGLNEAKLPMWIKPCLSMNKSFWNI